MKVAENVFKAISPLFTSSIRLVDVEYVKKSDGMHLVVLIDKDEGISIDDCVAVNDMITDVIDELNPTDDKPYCLDVSSYGLDRPLKFDWQFKKYLNQQVEVKLYRKVGDLKEFVATLVGFNEKEFNFSLEKENVTINRVDVAYITPYIDF